LESYRGKKRANKVDMDVQKAGRRGAKSNAVAKNIEALAGLANWGPNAAIFVHGWPHEELGDELSRCFGSGMAEGV
jgi:hypothetical protein